MLNSKRKLSFKHKLILSFLFFYILPLFLLMTSGYLWIESSVRDQETSSYQQMLDNTKGRMDDIFEGLQKYTVQLQQRFWFPALASTQNIKDSRFDLVDLRNFSEELDSFAASNQYVEDIFCYFVNSDSVISTTDKGWCTFQWFSEEAFQNPVFLDSGYREKVQEQVYPQYCELTCTRYQYKKEGILCAYPASKTSNRTICCTYFFLNKEKLETMLRESFSDKGSKVLILHNGEVLLNRTPWEPRDLTIDPGVSELLIDGEPYKILQSSSDLTGMVYYNFIREKDLYSNVIRLRWIMSISALVMALLGFLMSYYMAARNSRPLQNLLEKLENPPKIMTKDEFGLLDSAISTLMDREKSLESQIGTYRPMLKEVYLSWLLSNSSKVDETQTQASLELLGIRFPYSQFVCLFLDKKEDEAFLGKIDGFIRKYPCMSLMIFPKEGTVFLLNYEDDSQLELLLEELAGWLERQVAGCQVGVGEPCGLFAELSLSYQEAKAACDYRLTGCKGNLMFFRDISVADNSYYYPIEKENALRNCLKAGNLEGSVEILEGLIQINCGQPPLSPGRIKNFFYNADLTCLKCGEELGLPLKDEGELTQCHTLEDYTSRLVRIYQRICDYSKEKSSDGNAVLKDRICKYIQQNLKDPSLSLQSVASEFGVSDSYVSKLFKEYMKINFLNYVNLERIALAKSLLKNQHSIRIQDVGKMVGYENDATFRRIFKKHEGISPSQFRYLK